VRPEGIAGFQLWVNLPAKLKMTAPRYQEIRGSQIPELRKDAGPGADGPARLRVITGTVDGMTGPVTGIAADPTYLDVSVPAHSVFGHPVAAGHTAFAYVFEGEAQFGAVDDMTDVIIAPRLVVLTAGEAVRVRTEDRPVRFLLVSGKPLQEPIARYGPFVMNTAEEIDQTLRELREGTFVGK
jgi:redox-sensitive bicupin YhaK (pirin superfamily)